MKLLINRPADVVREALEGVAAAHGDRLRVQLDPAYGTVFLRMGGAVKGRARSLTWATGPRHCAPGSRA